MFSKIAIRFSIPVLVAMLLIMSILTMVMPASTIDSALTDGDPFVYLPIILKPPSPPGPNWINMYSNSNDLDVSFSSLIQYSNDKYIISGWTKNPSPSLSIYIDLITAVDGNGNVLWQTGIEDGIDNLIVTSDKHILGSGSSSNNNLIVMKLTDEGDIVWANQYGDADKSIYAGPTFELQDGSFIIIGEIIGYGADIFIINLNPDGSIIWQKTIGGTHFDEIVAATLTSNNTLFLLGETDNPPTSYDTPLLLELALDGSILWQKQIPDSECNFYSIIELNDGNFIAAGGAVNNAPGCILKVKDDGTPLWQKQVGDSINGIFEDVIQTADGTILASGSKMKPGTTINDGWLMAFDTNGNRLWEKTYGDQDANLFTDIQILNSGQLAIAGYTFLFTDEQSMGWLLKLDPDGSLDNCDWIQSGSSIVTNTVPTASTINLGTTVPTSTMTTASYVLHNVSLIQSELCSEGNDLATCE